MLNVPQSTSSQNGCTFIRANGSPVNCQRFMQGPTLSDGHWWSRQGDEKVWKEVLQPKQTPEQKSTIFGYEAKAFMARQYR